MNWKTISLAAVCGTLLGTTTLGADAPATDLTVKRTFTGTVTYVAGGQIQFGFNDNHRGWVDFSARPGALFKGPVRDVNGNITKQGDMILHIRDTYRVAMVAQSVAALRLAEVNLNYAKWNNDMEKKLGATNADSQQNVQLANQAYFGAIASLEGAKAALIQNQQIADVCSYRAQYDGIVDTVMVPAGYLAGEEPVMKIYEMNPIGVNVTIDNKLESVINYNTPITIISQRPGTKPAGILQGATILPGPGATFQTINKLIPPPAEANGLPVMAQWGLAAYLDFDAQGPNYTAGQALMITKNSIVQVEDKYFAWKVEGTKAITAGTGMNYISTVKLIPLTLGNTEKFIDNNTMMVEVKNSDISEGDVFLITDLVPATLKNGDKVCLYKPIYTFMPGDTVTVEIGPNPAITK